jgi:hypothetical protein
MATKDYTKTIATALRLLNKFGRSVTLVRRGLNQTAVDGASPWVVAVPTAVNVSLKAVFIDPRNSEDNYDFAIKSEYRTDRERVDYHVLIPSLYNGTTDIQVEPGDQIIDIARGQTYTVITVSPLSPGTPTVMFILQVQL